MLSRTVYTKYPVLLRIFPSQPGSRLGFFSCCKLSTLTSTPLYSSRLYAQNPVYSTIIFDYLRAVVYNRVQQYSTYDLACTHSRLPKSWRARRALAAIFAGSAAAGLAAVKQKQNRTLIPNAETHTLWYVTKQHAAASMPKHVQTPRSDISSCLACNAAAVVVTAFPCCCCRTRRVSISLAATKCRRRAFWRRDAGCTLPFF